MLPERIPPDGHLNLDSQLTSQVAKILILFVKIFHLPYVKCTR